MLSLREAETSAKGLVCCFNCISFQTFRALSADHARGYCGAHKAPVGIFGVCDRYVSDVVPPSERRELPPCPVCEGSQRVQDETIVGLWRRCTACGDGKDSQLAMFNMSLMRRVVKPAQMDAYEK